MRFLLILVAVASVQSCTAMRPFFEAGKACVGEANSAAANQILPEVNNALGCALSDSSALPSCAEDSLKNLGTVWGSAALLCALDKIANGVSLDPSDAAAPVKRKRAKAALERARVSQLHGSGGILAHAPPGYGPGPGGGG